MQEFLAAILEQHNRPLVLRKLRVNDPLYVGQVLVRMHYSGICAAQLGEIAAIKGIDKWLPHTLGHEGGGIVKSVGPGVTTVRPGDHVVVHWRRGVGIESLLPKYWCGELNREIGGGSNNTFQEYAVVSENRLTKIPETVPLDIAALLGCAVTTGLGVIFNELCVKPGQSVVVIGCGGVGLNVIQGAALVAARPIIGLDIKIPKLGLAMALGATHTILNDAFQPKTEETIKKLTLGGADFVIDTTGNPNMMELAWRLAAPQGRVCYVAQLKHDTFVSLQTLPMHQGKSLIGSDGGGTNPTVDIPRYLKLYDSGILNLSSLITHRYQLQDINLALDDIRAGNVGRAVLEMNQR